MPGTDPVFRVPVKLIPELLGNGENRGLSPILRGILRAQIDSGKQYFHDSWLDKFAAGFAWAPSLYSSPDNAIKIEICQMAKLTTVYWRDIPAQVIARERRDTAKLVLSERFAEAIDKAAMRAKMAGTDAYLEQWRRQDVNCGADLQAAVDAAAKKLEQDFDDERLEALVKNGGNAG